MNLNGEVWVTGRDGGVRGGEITRVSFTLRFQSIQISVSIYGHSWRGPSSLLNCYWYGLRQPVKSRQILNVLLRMRSDASLAQNRRLGEDREEECLKKGALISHLDLLFTRFSLVLPKPLKALIPRHNRLVRLQWLFTIQGHPNWFMPLSHVWVSFCYQAKKITWLPPFPPSFLSLVIASL